MREEQKSRPTTTMRNNTPRHATPLHPLDIPLEPLHGMKRPAHLERPDALQVLALEPQPDRRPRRCRAPRPPRAGQVRRGRRREPRQRRVGEDRRAVDEGPDELVGLPDAVAGQRRRERRVGHGCMNGWCLVAMAVATATAMSMGAEPRRWSVEVEVEMWGREPRMCGLDVQWAWKESEF